MWRGFLRLLGISGRNQPDTSYADTPATAQKAAVSISIEELIGLKSAVRGISLAAVRVKNNSITGAHASRFRGRGMDYQESRVYQPGDDVRSMDWRVTARTGHPYVKMYEEERERPVMLLIDLNPGMFFATRGVFKSVQAVKMAALIAWAAVANGDRIGALIFNGKHQELPPAGGAKGALRLFKLLMAAADPQKGIESLHTSIDRGDKPGLESALKRCRRVAKPGSLIFILSDFYNVCDDTSAQLLRLRQHNDVVAIQLYDTVEDTPPPAGVYGVSDGKQSSVIDTHNPAQLNHYQQWCAEHNAGLAAVMQKRAIALLRLSTEDDVVMALRRFMQKPGGNRKNRATKVAA